MTEWFLNFTLNQNHLEGPLKHRWLVATYRVAGSIRSDVEQKNLNFNKFPNDVNAPGPRITLRESHVVDTTDWLFDNYFQHPC